MFKWECSLIFSISKPLSGLHSELTEVTDALGVQPLSQLQTMTTQTNSHYSDDSNSALILLFPRYLYWCRYPLLNMGPVAIVHSCEFEKYRSKYLLVPPVGMFHKCKKDYKMALGLNLSLSIPRSLKVPWASSLV